MSSYKFNHLFKHDEQCFDFINSEFTYSMCPFKSMEQESLTSLSRDIHNLGIVFHSSQAQVDLRVESSAGQLESESGTINCFARGVLCKRVRLHHVIITLSLLI